MDDESSLVVRGRVSIVLDDESSLVVRGRVSIDIFVKGSVYILRDVVRILCTFLFFLFSYIILLSTDLVTIYL